ncbi:MAG: hypothetical protein LCH86_06750 [Proteobacteria bacterium]|nr:hypothetical protein [Pseudomonadota bacterium]
MTQTGTAGNCLTAALEPLSVAGEHRMAFFFYALSGKSWESAQDTCAESPKLSEDAEKRSTSPGMCVAPAAKTALESAARADMRATASMAKLILVGWLCENGFLT